MNEADTQTLVRLEASELGWPLWRNNVGAAMMADVSFIRYGLANDSKAMNKEIKSSDLIGPRPVVITQAMVGRTIGQFVAREIKHSGWRWRGTPAEKAQLRYLNLVASLGGDATFAIGKGTL